VVLVAVPCIAAVTLSRPERKFCVETPAQFQLPFEDVTFPARGGDVRISGWYIPRDAATRALVLVHGKDGSRNREFHHHFIDFAAAMHDRGFAILMIDMRGHGQSDDAHFTFGLREQRDIEGAVDWLEARGFKPGSIGLLGVSMGAASSMYATADDPDIGALVEDSGYAAIYPIIRHEWTRVSGLPSFFLPLTRIAGEVLLGFDLEAARPIDVVTRIAPRPLLIIHGVEDRLIPVADAESLKRAAPGADLWTVAGAGHAGAYTLDPRTYTERVAAFFDRGLK
jgi:pimeloyl-ACP methyl ester carboxylesterase